MYSLAFDSNAADLLYQYTFKQKSLSNIPRLYYEILKDITEQDFRVLTRENSQANFWDELNEFQRLRNDVVHQGIAVEKAFAENAINAATFVLDQIIPTILDRFNYHIEDGKIQYGSREYMQMVAKIEERKQQQKS